MHYSVAVKTAPAAEPLTLAETKLHLHVDADDEDELIEGLIQAAREWCENHCRRSFVRRTLELRLDCFPGEIRLPRGPVSSVTHVKYLDSGGALATLDADVYQLDIYSMPPRITLVAGATWPVTQTGALNAVLVEYLAGYAPGETSPTDFAENVPLSIKAALKILVAYWFENREEAGKVPASVKYLLGPWELRDFTLEA